MAYKLKEGKTIERDFAVVVNPQLKICSWKSNINFKDEAKIITVNVMLGTYVAGDWEKKIEEFGVVVELPYNGGEATIEELYKAISALDDPKLSYWENNI